MNTYTESSGMKQLSVGVGIVLETLAEHVPEMHGTEISEHDDNDGGSSSMIRILKYSVLEKRFGSYRIYSTRYSPAWISNSSVNPGPELIVNDGDNALGGE